MLLGHRPVKVIGYIEQAVWVFDCKNDGCRSKPVATIIAADSKKAEYFADFWKICHKFLLLKVTCGDIIRQKTRQFKSFDNTRQISTNCLQFFHNLGKYSSAIRNVLSTEWLYRQSPKARIKPYPVNQYKIRALSEESRPVLFPVYHWLPVSLP